MRETVQPSTFFWAKIALIPAPTRTNVKGRSKK